jgi:hypothetical protein
MDKLKYFVTTLDHSPRSAQLDAANFSNLFMAQKSRQISLFE